MRRNLVRDNLFSHILKTGASVTVGVAFMLSSPLTAGQVGSSAAPVSDWKQEEGAMGRPGQMQPGDIIKFGMPRKDLAPTRARLSTATTRFRFVGSVQAGR